MTNFQCGGIQRRFVDTPSIPDNPFRHDRSAIVEVNWGGSLSIHSKQVRREAIVTRFLFSNSVLRNSGYVVAILFKLSCVLMLRVERTKKNKSVTWARRVGDGDK